MPALVPQKSIKMFRLSLSFVLASLLAGSVLATPHSIRDCSTLCCNQVGDASDPAIAQFLGLLGVVASGTVGLQCSPLGSSCSGQVACCTNLNFNGLIATGC
ncbi:fungal hydrophobin [Mycena metata]|uniref:Hydrophobin n=1 Tax=Mycena metata TaxID=1033252 RepID=A0AAD7NKM6_9AGAR|nr:fungal hydrophobin [Mycena metata]